MKPYTGKIVESSGWNGPVYKLEKEDGKYTKTGDYEDVFKVADGTYVVSPYYSDSDTFMAGTAAEIVQLLCID